MNDRLAFGSARPSPGWVLPAVIWTPTSSFNRKWVLVKMGRPDTEHDSYGRFCEEHNFDGRADFLELLEAAKRHASKMEVKGTYFSYATKNDNKGNEARKSKNPWVHWKKSLFFWSKSKKKVSPRQDPPSSPVSTTIAHGVVPAFKRSALSGPITSSIDRRGSSHHYPSRRPTSGPLGFGGWFTPTRNRDLETPYMCLDQLDRPNHSKDFGTIYLVT